ncbi:hypothetical protein EDD53_2186 [Pacificibacter maritimus]|uniref:Lipoprotein n=1 Tax=Pacificibacter maritimus TaxID=762213 RepID=A0A3N4U6V2_9RHOB|nr:hypothetical protein [Pacificibacter maritimus]RPE66483.1 hypothetical protein EDD53_2186 [Pacificibacter maritimus]
MRFIYALPAVLVLSACSQQQMCISRANQDLRVVRGFITEAEGNLNRGYALQDKQIVRYKMVPCGSRPDGSEKRCRRPFEETVTERKAIDLDAEAAKLAVLRDKEAIFERKAAADILTCKATYPEG